MQLYTFATCSQDIRRRKVTRVCTTNITKKGHIFKLQVYYTCTIVHIMAHVHLEFVWHLFTFIVLSRVILATGIIDPFLIDKALALKSNWEKNLKNPASSSSVKTKVTVWCKQLFTNTYTLSTVNHYIKYFKIVNQIIYVLRC